LASITSVPPALQRSEKTEGFHARKMTECFILKRSFLEKDWFDKPEMLAVFLRILACANEMDVQGEIQRGQFKTSLNLMSDNTHISKKTIRTCLSKLKELKLIETNSCNRYTIISICNYDEYIGKQRETRANKEKTAQHIASTKGMQKGKEEISAATAKRKEKFYNELVPYVETYGKSMIRQFFDYWSETNKTCSRMRFEQEKTWVLELRLQRWSRQRKEYNSKTSSFALHNSDKKNYNEGGW